MYKISSDLLIKVTKAIDRFNSVKITDDSITKALLNLYKVNEEIKSKYDLTGYKTSK